MRRPVILICLTDCDSQFTIQNFAFCSELCLCFQFIRGMFRHYVDFHLLLKEKIGNGICKNVQQVLPQLWMFQYVPSADSGKMCEIIRDEPLRENWSSNFHYFTKRLVSVSNFKMHRLQSNIIYNDQIYDFFVIENNWWMQTTSVSSNLNLTRTGDNDIPIKNTKLQLSFMWCTSWLGETTNETFCKVKKESIGRNLHFPPYL